LRITEAEAGPRRPASVLFRFLAADFADTPDWSPLYLQGRAAQVPGRIKHTALIRTIRG